MKLVNNNTAPVKNNTLPVITEQEITHNETMAAARALLGKISDCFSDNKEELFDLLYDFFHPTSSLDKKSEIFEKIKEKADPAVQGYFFSTKGDGEMTFLFGSNKHRMTIRESRHPQKTVDNNGKLATLAAHLTRWNNIPNPQNADFPPKTFNPEGKTDSNNEVSITTEGKETIISGNWHDIVAASSRIEHLLQGQYSQGFTLDVNGRRHPAFFDPKSGRVYPGQEAFNQSHFWMTLPTYLQNILSLSKTDEVTIIITDNSPRE